MKNIFVLFLFLCILFSKLNAQIVLKSPIGGEVYNLGGIMNITWTCDSTADTLDIFLWDGNNLINIDNNIPVIQHFYNWNVPLAFNIGNHFRVKLSKHDSLHYKNYFSPGYFSVIPANQNPISIVRNDKISKNDINIYPNPATDFLIIKDLENGAKVQIFSVLGENVAESVYSGRLDVSPLQTGLYFLKTGNRILKFVKI
jgi:hypothetical protein